MEPFDLRQPEVACDSFRVGEKHSFPSGLSCGRLAGARRRCFEGAAFEVHHVPEGKAERT
jgi:hypothetical protein